MQKPKGAPPAPDRAIFQREGSASQPVPIEIPTKNEETEVIAHFRLDGGGHGTRTHGAVTPYLISNQAP